MSTRRTECTTQQEPVPVKPLKRLVSFDDSSIRKMLRSAYDDFVGDELELQLDNYVGISGFSDSSEHLGEGWTQLGRLRERAELQLFWDMFVQKQILYFDQEATLLLDISPKQKW